MGHGPVRGITNAIQVSAGSFNTCAVLSNHRVACWGDEQPVPVEVNGVTNAAAISTGDTQTCVLLLDGEVECGMVVSGRLNPG
jgi:hypothetical protein